MQRIPLLIVGAGPFGLSLAARARQRRIRCAVVGRPMDFWRSNMPRGMLLRSGCDWHLDPGDVDTIEAFLETRGLEPSDVEPLALELYLEYASWFQRRQGLEVRSDLVERLDRTDSRFVATLEHGEPIEADCVVLALGFRAFRNVPAELESMLPPGRWKHTCDAVELEAYPDQRCLIVGGRQSAFEWTALLHEVGAASIDLCYRHDTPAFARSDWSWFTEQADRMVDDPGWFRNLEPEEKEAVNARFWKEGRLKLEPWLAPRIRDERIRLRPHTEMVSCREWRGELDITLSDGASLRVDQVILATGYAVDMARLRLLASGNLLAELRVENGFPLLDECFQTNVPGLFVTSMPAIRDFGLFLAFTLSVRTSARLIAAAVEDRLRAARGSPSTGRSRG